MAAEATADADILSFVGGVAASLFASGTFSYTVNSIHNTVEASIQNDAHACTVSGTGVSITANDASTIDSIAIGVSVAGLAAGGAAVADNYIGTSSNTDNTVEATIEDATVTSTSGDISVTANSTGLIRSVAAGISGAGGVAIQASITDNEIYTKTQASITTPPSRRRAR